MSVSAEVIGDAYEAARIRVPADHKLFVIAVPTDKACSTESTFYVDVAGPLQLMQTASVLNAVAADFLNKAQNRS